METAKVDIRKLQQLNDRINQSIDALNQVRMSVHGLSHSTGNFPGAGFNPMGQTQSPFNFGQGQMPFSPFQNYPYPNVPNMPFQQPFPGFQHASYPFPPSPFAQAPIHPFFQNPFLAGQIPGQTPFPPFPGISPMSQGLFPGISHTTPFFPPTPFAAHGNLGIPGAFPTPFSGLSHTTPENFELPNRPLWADPFLASKIAYTFPYAPFPVPPVVNIF